MEPNEGAIDRILRVIVALGMIGINFFGIVPGWLGMTLMVIGLILLTTAIVGYCPFYWLIGASTRKSSS